MKAGLLLRQQHGQSKAPVPDFLFATAVKVEGLEGGTGRRSTELQSTSALS